MYKLFDLKGIVTLLLLVLFVSCGDSKNEDNDNGYFIWFGNASQLGGKWDLTERYLVLEDGDAIGDNDVIGNLNKTFKDWITKGSINWEFNSLNEKFEEYIDTGNEKRNLLGNYMIKSEEVVQMNFDADAFGKQGWVQDSNVGVRGNYFYMKQKLSKNDLDFLWKVYGDRNREFRANDKATMITRGRRVTE